MISRRGSILAALALFAVACASLVAPDYAEEAARFERLSFEYEAVAEELVEHRRAGRLDGNEWRTFALAQERIGGLSADAESLFEWWRATGQRPERIDGVLREIGDEILSLRQMAHRASTRPDGMGA
jgi:hypothetical protein